MTAPTQFRLLLLVAAGVACSSCIVEPQAPVSVEGWAIHLLADPGLTSFQIRETPLSDLQFSASPFVSINDVQSYHWDHHEITFTPGMKVKLDTLAARTGHLQGLPFVVTVGGEAVYAGAFWWSYSSSMPCSPYIEVMGPQLRKIALPPMFEGPDPRADERIYWSFMSAGILVRDTFFL